MYNTHLTSSSIYTIEALASPSQLIASGGPDKVICLSDPKEWEEGGEVGGSWGYG